MTRKEKKIDFVLFLITSLLILLGSVMVYSSSSALADGNDKFSSHAFFLKRQIFWLVVAAAALFAAAKINLERIRPLIVPALLGCLALLAIVFLMPEIRGTHRWMRIGPVTLQPSELFKYALIFYLAHSLSQKGRTLDSAKAYLWPYGVIVGGGALLIVAEPDLGSVLVLLGTVIVLLYLAGARLSHLIITLGGSALTVYVLVFIIGYKKIRVDTFLASVFDPMMASHQVKQSILSLSCGGFFGVGLGDGIFKQFFLPEPHTDFIFASIGEELGLLGLTITLGLLFGLIWRGIRISIGQRDRFHFLLGIGLTICLAVNMIINIAVVLGLIPTTGLALPFLSYGGSSLAVSAAAVGILLNLSRQRARALR
ncbi:MAG: putative lipid II flippase FtsW [FCB group bacterium]|nr:putative lipid II flippase FtsW [FCB group bacterium]